MNQQREVIYSLRAFALEGGEELKAEALKMIERGVQRRVEQALATFDRPEDWDFEYVQQDLLMHYMLQVPEFVAGTRPISLEAAQGVAREAGDNSFQQKLVGLDAVTDESGSGFGNRLLALVMLNVLDEKWKDHLYDLDQLRASIQYRAWGQKDPLIEYKQDAYAMFVDLMHDLANTFTERFLKAQLVFEQQAPPEPQPEPVRVVAAPTRRYNALGILEDYQPETELVATSDDPAEDARFVESGPGEPPASKPMVKGAPTVVGAGNIRSLGVGGGAMPAGWEATPRNNACPCGSGKKFKKCHGANT